MVLYYSVICFKNRKSENNTFLAPDEKSRGQRPKGGNKHEQI